MAKRLYVAYGSNLNLRQMKMRCPTAKLTGTGTAPDYELQFKGQSHGAYATIGQKDGASVPVAVWDINPKDERSLDIYEGYPSHYFKQDIAVKMENGEEITAMVYIMNQKMNFGVPSQSYYDTVYEGYEKCGLDTGILNKAVEESIEKFCTMPQKQGQCSLFYVNSDEVEDYDEDQDEDELTEDEPDEDDPFYSSDQLRM